MAPELKAGSQFQHPIRTDIKIRARTPQPECLIKAPAMGTQDQ